MDEQQRRSGICPPFAGQIELEQRGRLNYVHKSLSSALMGRVPKTPAETYARFLKLVTGTPFKVMPWSISSKVFSIMDRSCGEILKRSCR